MLRNLFCVFAALMLLWFKPSVPVCFGAGLIMLAIMSAKYNFSAPSAKYRRSAAKRMGLMLILGFAMICCGAQISHSPWHINVNSPADARYMLSSLLVYCFAVLGSPVFAWVYMSYPMYARRRRAHVRKVTAFQLHSFDEERIEGQMKIAV